MAAASGVARDVSSFLVPHQSSEDLVQQGIPAREARRRSFLRTCLMERLSSLLLFLLIWGIMLPALLPILLSVTLFWTAVHDSLSGGNVTTSITTLLFGHMHDSCNQPLGACVQIFWIVVGAKVVIIIMWSKLDCDDGSCRRVTQCFWGTFATLIVLFEVIWPLTTFIMLLLAQNCGQLRASALAVLSPFFLEAVCCCPILWCVARMGPTPMVDPEILIQSCTRINFDPQTFDDETYASWRWIIMCLTWLWCVQTPNWDMTLWRAIVIHVSCLTPQFLVQVGSWGHTFEGAPFSLSQNWQTLWLPDGPG